MKVRMKLKNKKPVEEALKDVIANGKWDEVHRALCERARLQIIHYTDKSEKDSRRVNK